MHTTAQEVDKIMSLPTCSVDQAAKVLGIGRTQAYRAVHTGEIKTFRIGGRLLVPTAALRQMFDGAHSAA
jgi:excisionase family DNA binding protein